MTRPFPDEFDPSTVPTYPVLTIAVHATGDNLYWVDVDGTPVPLGPDTDPTDPRQIAAAGIHHVSTECDQRGWDGVRVKAVDADGHTWMMIVGPDDQAADLTDTATEITNSPHRRWIIWLLAATLIAALGASAAIIWYIFIPHQPDTTPGDAVTPVPAELPVPAPAGWATHAIWSVPGRYQDIGALATHGAIWSVSTDDESTPHVDQIDPATGRIRTSHPIDSSGVTALVSTRVDGHHSVAVIADSQVTYLDPAHPDTIHTIPATPDQHISATPDCTWAVGDQSLALLTDHGFQPRTLPAASTPIGCDAGDIVTADTIGHVWHVGTGTLTTTPQTLTPPEQGARLASIIAIHDGVILADWSTTDGNAIAQWWNLATARQTATARHDSTLPDAHDRPTTTTGRWTAAGQVIIDWSAHRFITPPDTTPGDATIVGHWGWWSTDTTSTTINLATGHRHTVPMAATPAQPQFILDGHLGVIDHDSTTPGLYLLNPKDTP